MNSVRKQTVYIQINWDIDYTSTKHGQAIPHHSSRLTMVRNGLQQDLQVQTSTAEREDYPHSF